jgi:hypothetical protein
MSDTERHLYVHPDCAEWYCARSLDHARELAVAHWKECGIAEDEYSQWIDGIEAVDDGEKPAFRDEDGTPLYGIEITVADMILDAPYGLFFAGEP